MSTVDAATFKARAVELIGKAIAGQATVERFSELSERGIRMQLMLFVLPIKNLGAAEAEMNAFLRRFADFY